MDQFLQFVFSGITVGAVYALVALGFTLIYNASDVVNFAQGEFVMLGGMVTVAMAAGGVPLPIAALIAIVVTILAGLALYYFAVAPARGAPTVTLIIITLGAGIFIRGIVQIAIDKEFHKLPAFSGDTPFLVLGAAIMPQSLWVLGGALAIVVLLALFERTLAGKAMLATAANRMAARLVGINVTAIVGLCFALAAAIGALAGLLMTPLTLTSYNIGTALALKGFAAGTLGGFGSPLGAVVGGVILGVLEAFAAGYISSTYKDAVAFLVILAVLFAMPRGLLGKRIVERV